MSFLKLKNSIVKICLEILIQDKFKRSILKAKWAKLNLKKYVNYALGKIGEFENIQEENNEKIIWQYWHQDIENAPKIVKKCLASIKKHYPEYKINVLSFDTIKDYIELPQRFYWLLENKKISIAHFSDVLRVNLLSKYGGIWIDATMYATGKLADEILDADFFMFQKKKETDPMLNNNSCYFIKANKGNIFLEAIKTAIEKYWEENNYIINYFMFEHVVTMLSKANDNLNKQWNKMPCIYTDNVCFIQDKKFQKVDEGGVFDTIIKTTPIHKLTYKTIPDDYNEAGTYLSKLLEMN